MTQTFNIAPAGYAWDRTGSSWSGNEIDGLTTRYVALTRPDIEPWGAANYNSARILEHALVGRARRIGAWLADAPNAR